MSETARITTTEGEMVLEFWAEVAPQTVENFKTLPKRAFTTALVFIASSRAL